MTRPRLAIIVTDSISARFLLGDQLSFLEAQGLDIHLITTPGKHLDVIQRDHSLRVSPLVMHREIRPFADLKSLVQLVRLLRRAAPDGVSASTPKAGLLGLLAATLTRVPVRIYTARGLRLETTKGLKKALLTIAERITVRSAHHVVVVSKSLRQKYLDRNLASGSQLHILGSGSSNGVDCSRYRPRRDGNETRALAESVGIDSSAPVIGFVGRLAKDKGIEDLVAAFREIILERFQSAQLLVIGGFETGDRISSEVRRFLVNGPRVAHTGFVEDTAPWYRIMDVLAFPSSREGFPNAPLEAAATSIPVAGYAATGTVDAIRHGETGTLVPISDRHALGEALCNYLADPGMRDRHGSAGRRRALADFEQRKVWKAWRDFYLQVLDEVSSP